jgi:hypothetical protein
MSQWGKLDRSAILGSVWVVNGNVYLRGNATTVFTGNISAGDAILLNNVAYAVNTIISSNVLTLDAPYGGSTANLTTTAAQQSPKDLRTFGWEKTVTANTIGKQNVFGVDRTEVGVEGNKDKGFSIPGWSSHISYTTTQGSTRYKTEALVAMSKNFNANATGTLQTDANDNSTLANS